MSLRRQIALALLVPGGGGAATLLAALWIGRALGPQAQGPFNQVKSAIDFGAALATAGLAQALYVHLQSGRLAWPRALTLARRSALFGLVIGAALAWLSLGGRDAAQAAPAALMLAMAAAVALATLHAQWRALTLVGRATARFNAVTVVPQLLLLAVAAWIVARGGADSTGIAVAIALTWLAGCVYAARVLHGVRRETAPRTALVRPADTATPAPLATTQQPAPARASLRGHALASWATASLAAGAIVLVQQLAERAGGAAGLGLISLALLLVQVPLTPLAYALPLLLRHRLQGAGGADGARRGASDASDASDASGASGASGAADASDGLRPRMAAQAWRIVLPVAALAAAAVAVGAAWRSDFGLGAGYAGLHRLLGVMLLGGAAEAALRVLGVDAQAEGRPSRSALAEAARVLALAAGAWALLTPLPSGASASGATAESAAATMEPLAWLWSGATIVAAVLAAVLAWQQRPPR